MSLQLWSEIEVVVLRRSDHACIKIRRMTYQEWLEFQPKVADKPQFSFHAFQPGYHGYKDPENKASTT